MAWWEANTKGALQITMRATDHDPYTCDYCTAVVRAKVRAAREERCEQA